LCGQTSGEPLCSFTRNAADLKAVPLSLQGKRFANVRIELESNAARTQAPTVHRWRLDYTCAAGD